MAAYWSEVSNSLVEMALDLINKYHPVLRDVSIGFIFRSEPSASGGKEITAGVQKVDAKMRALGVDYDFLIWIDVTAWDNSDEARRKALLDHQLCHICWDGEKGSIRGHDIEEFQEVLERWGAWNSPLFKAQIALQKIQLSFLDRGRVGAVDPAEMPAVELRKL